MKQLLKRLIPRTNRLRVFVASAAEIPVPALPAGTEVRALSADDLRANAAGDRNFRDVQIARLERFGASHAYGIFVKGELAHVSWLLPAEAMGKDVPRVLRPLPDDAEITGCETLPAFRGRGLYPLAIGWLVRLASQGGVRRVYMKTSPKNLASQAGIRKAGLAPAGTLVLVWLPGRKEPLVWPSRVAT